MGRQQIINYYNATEIDYRLVWNLNKSLALHFGYWDKTTKSLPQALEKENEVLANLAKIKSSDYVLDAGCGVGGSSIYLAKKFGCKVLGINLSKKQVETAIQNAKKFGVSDLVKFEVADYTDTKSKTVVFSVIWAIESVCHADDKFKFVKEAFRVLKRGGRLVMADFYSRNNGKRSKELSIYNNWNQGWAVDNFETVDNFKTYLKRVGFESIKHINATKNIYPSAKRLYLASIPGLFVGRIMQLMGMRTALQNQNIIAVNLQYKALKKGLWEYGIFYAEKP